MACLQGCNKIHIKLFVYHISFCIICTQLPLQDYTTHNTIVNCLNNRMQIITVSFNNIISLFRVDNVCFFHSLLHKHVCTQNNIKIYTDPNLHIYIRRCYKSVYNTLSERVNAFHGILNSCRFKVKLQALVVDKRGATRAPL